MVKIMKDVGNDMVHNMMRHHIGRTSLLACHEQPHLLKRQISSHLATAELSCPLCCLPSRSFSISCHVTVPSLLSASARCSSDDTSLTAVPLMTPVNLFSFCLVPSCSTRSGFLVFALIYQG